MSRYKIPLTTALGIALTIATAACQRDAAGPETQTTTGVQPRMETLSVGGCLRAGLAPNTFVLTVAASTGGTDTATYQLSGTAVALGEYVGQNVNVTGTLRSEQQVASSGVDVVDEPTKGTTGTPTIETTTELTVKEMTVTAVNASGERCAD